MILISDGQQNLHVQEGDWKETRVISDKSFPPRAQEHLVYHTNLTNAFWKITS